MKKASISILKAQLSRYLDAVKSGEEVIVTERGRPVARLSAIDSAESPTGRAAQLIREGRMRPPLDPAPGKRTIEPEGRDPEGRSLEYVLEEREKGR